MKYVCRIDTNCFYRYECFGSRLKPLDHLWTLPDDPRPVRSIWRSACVDSEKPIITLVRISLPIALNCTHHRPGFCCHKLVSRPSKSILEWGLGCLRSRATFRGDRITLRKPVSVAIQGAWKEFELFSSWWYFPQAKSATRFRFSVRITAGSA